MKNIHFIGIGGIGMSGLAAAACDLGINVSGSDRGSENRENRAIFNALRSQGITVFPQDGSRFAAGSVPPDHIVYSSAIEDDNPDFLAAGEIPRLHRSKLLRYLLDAFGRKSIAVTGSCGKSTVCCYLAEALTNLGADPVMLSGALSKRFRSDKFAGNYRPGKGDFLVFEADESDKSLLNYGADYAIILNIGTDHYDTSELKRVFSEFLVHIRCGAVLTREVYNALRDTIPGNLTVKVVDTSADTDAEYSLLDYRKENSAPTATFTGGAKLLLPKHGRHMATNALCIKAMLEMTGFSPDDALTALSRFDGVWRRDDFAGKTANGTQVFDDYAHNPEKILSCLQGMRERISGNIYAVFQPHGYKPFGFMEEQLFKYMDDFLNTGDRLMLLEPFYAGGTSSFKPSSAEVVEKWRKNTSAPERFSVFPDRKTLADFLKETPAENDLIVIMGARDNSLSDFAAELAGKEV